jgi:hypothetical protein
MKRVLLFSTTLWRFGFAMEKEIRETATMAYAKNKKISVRGPRNGLF